MTRPSPAQVRAVASCDTPAQLAGLRAYWRTVTGLSPDLAALLDMRERQVAPHPLPPASGRADGPGPGASPSGSGLPRVRPEGLA